MRANFIQIYDSFYNINLVEYITKPKYQSGMFFYKIGFKNEIEQNIFSPKVDFFSEKDPPELEQFYKQREELIKIVTKNKVFKIQ